MVGRRSQYNIVHVCMSLITRVLQFTTSCSSDTFTRLKHNDINSRYGIEIEKTFLYFIVIIVFFERKLNNGEWKCNREFLRTKTWMTITGK